MYTSHLRHQLHLSGKKIALLAVLLFGIASGQTWAQRIPNSKKNFYGINQADYEHKVMHYGFFLAYHNSHYNITHSAQFVTTKDSLLAINPANTSGFGIGIVANYRFSRLFSLRLLPTFSFYGKNVDYVINDPITNKITTISETREATNVEIPLLLKFQSERRDNVRMYLVAGLKASIEANTKKKEGGNEHLNLSNTDLAVEYGAGFDLFYEFVKFSPEIRFSHGLLNLLDPSGNKYSRGIQNLSSHTVSLYLHFE
jgi:hypothetical protein